MNSTELCYTPATKLLPLIRSKKLSPVELTRAVLERIERLNPRLNAFCLVTAEAAMKAAREAEQAMGDIAAHVQVDNIVTQFQQQSHQLKRVLRVINFFAFRLAVTGNVDDRARNFLPTKRLADSYEVGLHTTMRRWIRAELEYSHER